MEWEYKNCNIGNDISEWEIEVKTFKGLLKIIDETGFPLIIDKEYMTLTIYDGYLENFFRSIEE